MSSMDHYIIELEEKLDKAEKSLLAAEELSESVDAHIAYCLTSDPQLPIADLAKALDDFRKSTQGK